MCLEYLTCNQPNVKWMHKMCGHDVYINVEGDIFCKNNCFKPYFRQETRFHCGAEYHAEWIKIKNEDQDKLIFNLSL